MIDPRDSMTDFNDLINNQVECADQNQDQDPDPYDDQNGQDDDQDEEN